MLALSVGQRRVIEDSEVAAAAAVAVAVAFEVAVAVAVQVPVERAVSAMPGAGKGAASV